MVTTEWETLSRTVAYNRYQYNGTFKKKNELTIFVLYETGNLANKRMKHDDIFINYIANQYHVDYMIIITHSGKAEGWLLRPTLKKIYEKEACESIEQDLNRFIMQRALNP